MTALQLAWDRLLEALPARWQVGPVSVADPSRGTWSVTAIGPHPGRGKAPQTVTGTGGSDVGALEDLDARLRGERPEDTGGRLAELEARARLAFLEAAEQHSRETLGRPLTAAELRGVLRRAPEG